MRSGSRYNWGDISHGRTTTARLDESESLGEQHAIHAVPFSPATRPHPPMTPIEATAVIFGLLCVWLTVRQNIWCWPTGLVQVVLYIFSS